MNENYNLVPYVFQNQELTKRVEVIRKEMNSVLRSANVIGKALYEIKNQELYKTDFSTFESCIESFGIKRAQGYNLIKGYEVGEKRLIRKDNGNPEKISTLYSNTQCVELAKLKEDVKILNMLDEGKVNPKMSTKEIREVVDKELHPEKYVEKVEEVEEVEEVTENVKSEDTPFSNDTKKESVAYIYVYEGKLYCQLWDDGKALEMKDKVLSATDYDKIMNVLAKYQA